MTVGLLATRSGNVPPGRTLGQGTTGVSRLIRDIQGLQMLDEQLAGAGMRGAEAAQKTYDDADESLLGMLEAFRELVCSYLFTYDDKLSTTSETPAVRTWAAQWYHPNAPTVVTSLPQLEAPLTSPLTLPSFPGNLFYLATQDDMQRHNRKLFEQIVADRVSYPDKTDAQLVAARLPYHAVQPDVYLPKVLCDRWKALLNNTAGSTVQLGLYADGSPATVSNVQHHAEEVIGIAGLQTLHGYQRFMVLRDLSRYLEAVPLETAHQLVTFVASSDQLDLEAAGPGGLASTWLAYGKLVLSPYPDLKSVLFERLSERRSAEGMRPVWEWLTKLDTVSDADPLSNKQDEHGYFLPQAEWRNLAAYCEQFVRERKPDFVQWLGRNASTLALFMEGDPSTVLDPASPESRLQLIGWLGQVRSVGGILGFEGVLLLAILTALDRCRTVLLTRGSADYVGDPDSDLKQYAQEGLDLVQYLSNKGTLPGMFGALREEGG